MKRLIFVTGIVSTVFSLLVIAWATAQWAGIRTTEEFFLAVVSLPLLGIVPLIGSILMIRYSVRSGTGERDYRNRTAASEVTRTEQRLTRAGRAMKASLFVDSVGLKRPARPRSSDHCCRSSLGKIKTN